MWSNTHLWFCSALLILKILIFWGGCFFQHRSQKRSLHYWYFQPSLNIYSFWYSWSDSLLSQFGKAWSSAAGSEERERLLGTSLDTHISRCSAQPPCQFLLLRNEWPHPKLLTQFDQNLPRPRQWENSTQCPVGYLQPEICRNLV